MVGILIGAVSKSALVENKFIIYAPPGGMVGMVIFVVIGAATNLGLPATKLVTGAFVVVVLVVT